MGTGPVAGGTSSSSNIMYFNAMDNHVVPLTRQFGSLSEFLSYHEDDASGTVTGVAAEMGELAGYMKAGIETFMQGE